MGAPARLWPTAHALLAPSSILHTSTTSPAGVSKSSQTASSSARAMARTRRGRAGAREGCTVVRMPLWEAAAPERRAPGSRGVVRMRRPAAKRAADRGAAVVGRGAAVVARIAMARGIGGGGRRAASSYRAESDGRSRSHPPLSLLAPAHRPPSLETRPHDAPACADPVPAARGRARRARQSRPPRPPPGARTAPAGRGRALERAPPGRAASGG